MTTQPQQAPLPWISTKMLELNRCVCDALTNRGAGPVCWCGVAPGASVAWDFCTGCDNGKCGMGWVRLASTYPSSTFPQPADDATCKSPLAFSIEVGALRCMAGMGEDGEPPSEGDMLGTSLDLNADMLALHYAVECCFGSDMHALEPYQPVGPQGGCVGGLWVVTVTF